MWAKPSNDAEVGFLAIRQKTMARAVFSRIIRREFLGISLVCLPHGSGDKSDPD